MPSPSQRKSRSCYVGMPQSDEDGRTVASAQADERSQP